MRERAKKKKRDRDRERKTNNTTQKGLEVLENHIQELGNRRADSYLTGYHTGCVIY